MKCACLLILLLLCTLASSATGQKYIFYLHGAILEQQGANAVSPQYGSYEYKAILDSFRVNGFYVISEVRPKNTDAKEYAKKVARQIDSLLKTGVPSGDITVIGASKGGLIAQYVSTLLKNKQINFVILAGCFANATKQYPDLLLSGNILSIHEKSDDIGLSCEPVKEKSGANIPHFREIEINTGLKHGFLFRPLPDWVKPALQWANGIH